MTPYQRRQLDLMRQMESSLADNPSASTIVSMRPDYVNDPSRCLTSVTFVPPKLGAIIEEQLIKPLRLIEPDFYYYPSSALHVTIGSIRVTQYPPNFTDTDIEKAANTLTKIIPSERAFPFTFQGILSMPTSASIIVLIDERFDAFVKRLRTAFTDAGVPDDKKYFTDEVVFANTTFCRYTHKPSEKFLKELQKHRDEFLGDMTAETISLITTNAGAHPSKTLVLGTYRFGQNRG